MLDPKWEAMEKRLRREMDDAQEGLEAKYTLETRMRHMNAVLAYIDFLTTTPACDCCETVLSRKQTA